jgi:hypothetical protein
MPQVTSEAWVPVPPETPFAVSQTTGETRLLWDPFIRHQHLIDAERPARGVRTLTRARIGPRMVSQYVSYRPPTSVGMTMVSGARAVRKYTYTVRPGWLRFVAEPIGQWLLGRETAARIRAFAGTCEDPRVLAAIRAD